MLRRLDWQVWAVLGAGLLAAVIAVGYGLYVTSDGAKTDDLREWLADAHKYDPKYEDLGTVTYEDGDVVVDASEVWADPDYGGYFLCSWVEPWLRDLGNGDEDSQIIVRMGGQEILRSRGPSESCADAEPQV